MWIYKAWMQFLHSLKYLPTILLLLLWVYLIFIDFNSGGLFLLLCLSPIIILQCVFRLFR